MNVRYVCLWVMALGLLVVTLWLVVMPRVILRLGCDREGDRKVLDAQMDFFCPAGNKVVYDAWGECGLKKECLAPTTGVVDGSKFVSLGGRLQSKTLYSKGRQTGGWTGYDREGAAISEDGGYLAPVEPPARH